jgi:hypothetical protein
MSVDDGLDDEMERLAADAEARSLEDRVAELVKTAAVPMPGR